jgi:hypothetical protein
MIHPKYRERVGKTGSLWLGIALSKPLLLLIMGAVFSFITSRPAFSGEGVDDGLVNASSVFIAGAAMLVLAFSPTLLFKYMPLLPSSSTSLGANRQSIAGAAMVAGAGAGVSAAIRQRRTAQIQSGTAGGNRAGGAGAPQSAGQGTPGLGGGEQGSPGLGAPGRRSAAGRLANTSGTAASQETRTIGELQKDDRAGTGGANAARAVRTGAASVGRGSAKIAAGGATAFLLAGRETARQASMRGQRATQSMVPDTDHISGR